MLNINRKTVFMLLLAMFFICIMPSAGFSAGSCEGQLKAADDQVDIDTHNLVPADIMKNIARVNKEVDNKVARFMFLGRAIICASTDFLAKEWSLLIITIRVPDLSLLVAGQAVWILGALLSLIIGFYLCDISFKLGFAIMSMPIAIALWPFEKTKQYLGKIISLMLHCAGVLIFLCLGVTMAIALFDGAVTSSIPDSGMIDISASGDVVKTIIDHFRDDLGSEILSAFDLMSFNFLLLLFAGIYGFNLIGKSVNEYTSKFFPDSTGMGSQNPMHKGLTQATDFAKKQVGKVGAYAKDVAKTQAGRLGAKAGGKISGAISKVGAGIQKAAEKMGPAGLLMKGVGKAMQKAGDTGKKMADNHEAKYQNQGKAGELKNGRWQPKGEGGAAGGGAGGAGGNKPDGNKPGAGGNKPEAGGGAAGGGAGGSGGNPLGGGK